MIDLSNPDAVIAEAERRRRLREQGRRTFDVSATVRMADDGQLEATDLLGERVIDATELGQLEDKIKARGDKLVRAIAGKVISFSQPRASKQTPGIADSLYVFPRHHRAIWWEWKAPEGRQRPDQKTFEEDVTAGGHEYVCGGLGDFKAWLTAERIVAGFEHDDAPDGTPIPIPLPLNEAP